VKTAAVALPAAAVMAGGVAAAPPGPPQIRESPARTCFAAAERAWLAYRRASCSSLGDAFKDGTLAKIKYAECVGDVNRQHIRQLIQFETALRGH
jgi:uncharacterized protein YecT (DUF1311 family)